jgi:uncharacterized Fe-S cluster-containing radical SAM superfamily enzyme
MATETAQEVRTEEGDVKATDRASKLKNILAKISSNNKTAKSDGNNLKLKTASQSSDETASQFGMIKFGDSIVGTDIIETRFKNGHCKGMLNGVIEEKLS